MVYSLAAEENDIGGFLIDDIFSSIARIIPVYGGADTGTEHWANHLSYSFTKKIQSLNN